MIADITTTKYKSKFLYRKAAIEKFQMKVKAIVDSLDDYVYKNELHKIHNSDKI